MENGTPFVADLFGVREGGARSPGSEWSAMEHSGVEALALPSIAGAQEEEAVMKAVMAVDPELDAGFGEVVAAPKGRARDLTGRDRFRVGLFEGVEGLL